MIRKAFYIFMLTVITYGATGCDQNKRPEGLLSEEEMVPIIKDMQIGYSGVDQTVKNPRQRTLKYEEMNQLVLKKHGVERKTFYDSYDYYSLEPALMDTILQRVNIVLVQELDSLKGNRKKNAAEKPAAIKP